MDLKEIMEQKNFVVIGNTIRTTKYAAKIKKSLLEKDYIVAGVGSELKSVNDVDFDIDIIDLCINANDGLRLLKENRKPFKCIVIQPGAESDELINWLNEQKISFIEGCLLVGLSAYTK